MFGGTFDPPHRGHCSVALDVAEALDLDEVIWVPAGNPPHKKRRLTPAHLRLRMVRAATSGEPRFRVSEVEIHREGVSYTVDTLDALHDEAPDAELYLIVGLDQYRIFDTWREPARILTLASLAVMDREGESIVAAEGVSGDEAVPGRPLAPGAVISVPVERIDISSTQVRAAVRRGEAIEQLVPREVARIIEAEGLYQRDLPGGRGGS